MDPSNEVRTIKELSGLATNQGEQEPRIITTRYASSVEEVNILRAMLMGTRTTRALQTKIRSMGPVGAP